MTEYPHESVFAEPANKMTKITALKLMKNFYREKSITSPSLHLVQQNLATMPFSLVLIRYKPLNKIIFETIDHLISAGIAQRIKLNNPPTNNEESDPRPLTMDHLGVCFIAIAICWALSTVVFAGEWITKLAGDAIERRRRQGR